MSYTTEAEARRYAGGIGEDKVSSTDVLAFIEMADSLIDQLSGHDWQLHEDAIEYHNGSQFRKLTLDNYPVVGITSISKRVDGAWVALVVFDEEAGTGDYQLMKPQAGIVVLTSENWPTEGQSAIKVVYDYGYATTPTLIGKLAAMLTAIYIYSAAAGEVSPDGLVSISEGDLSLSWGGGAFAKQIENLERQSSAILKEIGRRLICVPTAG